MVSQKSHEYQHSSILQLVFPIEESSRSQDVLVRWNKAGSTSDPLTNDRAIRILLHFAGALIQNYLLNDFYTFQGISKDSLDQLLPGVQSS